MKGLTATFQRRRLDLPEGALHEGDPVLLQVPGKVGGGLAVTERKRTLLLRAIEHARRGQGVDGRQLLEHARHWLLRLQLLRPTAIGNHNSGRMMASIPANAIAKPGNSRMAAAHLSSHSA